MVKMESLLTKMGERLKGLRKEQNWLQADVCDRIHVSLPAYRSWENGEVIPRVEYVVHLADLYGVSTDFLLGISDVRGVGYKEVEDITGLSQATIATLHELHESEHRGSGQMALRAVNALLEDQTHGFSALRFIGEYILGRFQYFSVPGSGVYNSKVLMTEFPADGMGSASLLDIQRASSAETMTLIQECLFELRNKFRAEKGGA